MFTIRVGFVCVGYSCKYLRGNIERNIIIFSLVFFVANNLPELRLNRLADTPLADTRNQNIVTKLNAAFKSSV